ncbi:helix-turn-helix transcriptional regulator [Clostridium oryzae]|uniref:Transcriptional repressor CcpN n=1 Tax=Clostridium oryzae TaxID=1450648 RepID=A0A1V4IIE2_9CLOT|nr:helix-turn-helix transcriptional regulator [Clostridium oryzae]OPJ59455.1 transcriptional repressor CcpN [Clostridium oryzae]
MRVIKLSPRQERIIKLVKDNQPITSEHIADKLGVTRAALRPDLAILKMSGILGAKPKVGYIYSEKKQNNAIYDYIISIRVKDIMSEPAIVKENTSIYDAIIYLFLKDVGTLFVESDEGLLVGAVSRKDFLKAAMGNTDIQKVPVGIIMTRMPNVFFVEKEDSVFLVAQKIIDREVDSLPVIERVFDNNKVNYKVIGKISKTNIIKLFAALGAKG